MCRIRYKSLAFYPELQLFYTNLQNIFTPVLLVFTNVSGLICNFCK